MNEYLWLFFRIYAVDSSPMAFERVLRGVVFPLVDTVAASVGPAEWFYLRFVDRTGPHIRFRLKVPKERALEYDAFIHERLMKAERSVVDYFRRSIYTPERRKFGTDESLARAEETFVSSSNVARMLLEMPERPANLILGSACMIAMTERIPEDSRRSFLYHYGWYWAGGPALPAGRSWRQTIPAVTEQRVRSLIEGCQRLMMRNVTLSASIKRLAQRVVPFGEAKAAANRSALFTAFHQMHLHNNRLGVHMRAEATLAALLGMVDFKGLALDTPSQDFAKQGADK